ncbi:MAG: very short patch repair endonuclease [Candidatus Thermoplasmatota archaeon]|jgi:DNA mismatch endonuclease (patch repair protein)|nr:very short patch repair endonuclease [Candidatus Thermoplasmatota archaeon]
MSRIRSANTSLELKVRKYLSSRGYRYRLHYPLRGRPDIAFPRQKVAVFVNGCFWHLHGCRLSPVPKTRTAFWREKLEGNRERDKKTLARLKAEGWRPVVLWECGIEKSLPREVRHIERILQARRV